MGTPNPKTIRDRKGRELETICGDPDELYEKRGHIDSSYGLTQDMRVDRMAEIHPVVHYNDKKQGREFVLDCDLYREPGSNNFTLTLYCPRCKNLLKIDSRMKHIDYDPGRGLSVEPFKCTWEIGRGTDGTKADRMEFGLGLCNWTVAIDDGIARDA